MSQKISLKTLKQALHNNEFQFYYQPQVSLITGEIIGVEALIRWIGAEGEIIPPNAFLPLAEESGYITKISLAMLDQLAEHSRYIHQLNPNILISMNLSGKDIGKKKLHKKLKHMLDENILDKEKTAFELTETVAIELLSLQAFNDLKEMNVTLIMDDYGAGYANLSTLVNTPFSKIKLDKTLIDSLCHDRKRQVVVKESLRMAHCLGVDVVAEGIEHEHTYHFLQQHGCTSVQGYLIAKPMPLEALMHFIGNFEIMSASPIGLLHQAQLDHLEWRKDLLNLTIFTPTEQTITSLHLEDHTQCSFGRWYFTIGQRYAHLKVFQDIDPVHQDIHETAQKLVEGLTRFNQKQLTVLVNKLNRQSIQLLVLFHKLELSIIESLRSEQDAKKDSP